MQVASNFWCTRFAYRPGQPRVLIMAMKSKDLVADARQARLALQAAIGKRVRDIRIDRGIGQAECAREAGMDKSSMFRLEKGEQNVTIDMLGRIALVLDVELGELVSGIELDPTLISVGPDA